MSSLEDFMAEFQAKNPGLASPEEIEAAWKQLWPYEEAFSPERHFYLRAAAASRTTFNWPADSEPALAEDEA